MKRFSYVFKLILIFSLMLWQFPAGSSATDLVDKPERNVESILDETVDDSPQSAGGIQVTNLEEGITAAALVNEILGEGVEIRNSSYTGASAAAGTFLDPTSTFGFSNGIILSSGAAKGVMGSNTVSDFTRSNETPGDPDLEALLGEIDITYDAAVLEFEFKPTSDKISFQYVLASEEYPHFLEYSDAFAFFANGQNVALIPGTSEPVTITNINHEKNAQYYKSNESGQYQTQMNGMTKVLSAEANVVPGEWNKMKLVIADYLDDSYDSNVMIKADSIKDGEAKAGKFKLGKVTHTYDESTGRVTAHTEAIRQNGSDGDITLHWERSTSEGTMQVAVDFPDGVTTQTLSIDFPKEDTMATIKLLGATATAEIDKANSLEYLHIKQITADADEIILTEGDSKSLGVHAYNFDDVEVGLNGARIHSSNGSSVEYGDRGQLYALAKGDSIVSVQYGGHTIEIPVKVLPAVNDIQVEPQSVELEQNTAQSVKVYAELTDGTKEDVTEQATFISSDEKIFTIDQSGNIIAIGVGSAEATVQFTQFAKTIPVIVTKAPEITGLEVTPASITITEGESAAIQVKAIYDDGTKTDVTKNAIYLLSDEELASISEGVLTAAKPGTAEVTVQYGGFEEKITLTVEAKIEQLEITPADLTVQKGEKQQLQVFGIAASQTEKIDLTEKVSYQISDNTIVTVSSKGELTALSEGEAELTAEYKGISVNAKITVINELLSIEIGPEEIKLTEGELLPITVTAKYADGASEDITQQAAFSIKDTTIAEITAEKHITALAEGITELTAEFAGLSKTIPIEVMAAPKGLLLNIVDEQNNPIHNVSLAIEDEAGKFEKFAVNNPYTNELTQGKYKLYIYKQGYQPVYKEIEIKDKQQTVVTAHLVKSDLVSGSWSVDKMSIGEIIAAGIDPNDPANRWVYKFELHLALNGEDHYIPYYINGKGTIFGEGASGTLINGNRYYPVAVPFIGHEDIPPMVGYMIIPGEVSWLKEFFDVKLSLTNLATEPFTLKDANVTLNLPAGLSLAPTADPQSLQFNIGEIAGGKTGKASWVVRGDQKGSYHLSADFSSKLFPFNEEVKASFKTSEPLTVWGDSAIRILAQVEKEVHRGMPYLVKFTVFNVSDGPVNDLRLKLLEDGKLNYFYSPNQQLEYSIDSLPAGEYKTFEYLLVPTVNANINLADSFTLQTGGNATVEVVIATLD